MINDRQNRFLPAQEHMSAPDRFPLSGFDLIDSDRRSGFPVCRDFLTSDRFRRPGFP